MQTKTTAAKEIAVQVIVDGYKIDLQGANITLVRSATGVATLQIAGTGSDLNQAADLATYLQAIELTTVAQVDG
jgi:hypothetical protein